MKVNINQIIKVKLTDNGNKIIKNDPYYYELWYNKETKELTVPLWCLFEIFGNGICSNLKHYFENDEIEIVKEEK